LPLHTHPYWLDGINPAGSACDGPGWRLVRRALVERHPISRSTRSTSRSVLETVFMFHALPVTNHRVHVRSRDEPAPMRACVACSHMCYERLLWIDTGVRLWPLVKHPNRRTTRAAAVSPSTPRRNSSHTHERYTASPRTERGAVAPRDGLGVRFRPRLRTGACRPGLPSRRVVTVDVRPSSPSSRGYRPPSVVHHHRAQPHHRSRRRHNG
jgi:hypothetical protein